MDICFGVLVFKYVFGSKFFVWFGENVKWGLLELNGLVNFYSSDIGELVVVLNVIVLIGFWIGVVGVVVSCFLVNLDVMILLVVGMGS